MAKSTCVTQDKDRIGETTEARTLVCEGGSVGVVDQGTRVGEHRPEAFFASEQRVGVDVGEDGGGGVPTRRRRSTKRWPSRRRIASSVARVPARCLPRPAGAPAAHVQRRKTPYLLNLSDRRAERSLLTAARHLPESSSRDLRGRGCWLDANCVESILSMMAASPCCRPPRVVQRCHMPRALAQVWLSFTMRRTTADDASSRMKSWLDSPPTDAPRIAAERRRTTSIADTLRCDSTAKGSRPWTFRSRGAALLSNWR